MKDNNRNYVSGQNVIMTDNIPPATATTNITIATATGQQETTEYNNSLSPLTVSTVADYQLSLLYIVVTSLSIGPSL